VRQVSAKGDAPSDRMDGSKWMTAGARGGHFIAAEAYPFGNRARSRAGTGDRATFIWEPVLYTRGAIRAVTSVPWREEFRVVPRPKRLR